MQSYEAWDMVKNICIYNGEYRSILKDEILDYITYQNHIDENKINLVDVKTLNEQALKTVGIKIYINPW